ncbi:helix-turn-helix domain-containing protein [Aquimarina sp. MAR_2010_214]|uniref:helix-turn-helix domain-containing protein n=1 Tax=Aquimarina sp. MAR_2010_214 TaxID=1250026 RepID=UPI000C70E693|nr:helix-turn-helix domain-containing protein [Aquimarina sp. MAR_2010_214]
MSSDKENEYFCDGLTEEIINALAQIKGLKITSRTSSFFFKNKDIPVSKIGKDLNVSILLEGSVRLSKDTIRVTAQLIEIQGDFHFWSETWDRKLENIFTIQDEISLLIADKIRENFGHFEIRDKLVDKQTDYIEAYQLYLKGNYHFQKWNPEDLELSKQYYSKALEIDANYAQSNFGLAQYYTMMAGLGFLPKTEAFKKANKYINKALGLNPQLPEVHYGLASISYWYEWDFKKTFQHLNKALEMNPNFAPAYIHLAVHNCTSGEPQKALKHIEIAITLDPLSSEVYFAKGYIYYLIEDYQTSIKFLDISLELNPFNLLATIIRACCWIQQNKIHQVIDYFTSDLPAAVDNSTKYGILGMAYAILNDSEKLENYLELLHTEIDKMQAERAQFFVFLIQILSNQKKKALNWLRVAIETKPTLMLLLFSDPMLNSIKEDIEYKEIIKNVFPLTIEVEKKGKKRKELLSKEQTKEYAQKLLNHIRQDTPYLNPDLTLKSLASHLEIHPNQLSWLINHEFNKNFSEFINHYRVEAFKRISKDPKNSHITLIGLAFESGFNSKTVFNTFFKKETGMTPMQYLKL